MKSLEVEEEAFQKLEARAKEKGITLTDYVASLVPLVEKGDN